MADDSLFRQKAPWIMERLRDDFGLTVDQAAAIVGNLGHESGGFKHFQEIAPIVKGSRGGWGWAQWTGPRRDAFDEWVAARGLDPRSDEANYSFLKHELQTSHRSAIASVTAAPTLEEAVRRFEKKFEGAAEKYKGYPSRERYARVAREAYLGRDLGEAGTETQLAVGELSFGTKGPQVLALQEALFRLDYPVGKRDGDFGGITRAAVLAFQADNNLETTGVVDKATWDKLATASPRPLARERATATAADLISLGSNTVIQGNRTRNLGWLSGILGVLGLGTSAIRTAGEATASTPIVDMAATRIPPGVADSIINLQGALAALGTGPRATQAQAILRELQAQLPPSIPDALRSLQATIASMGSGPKASAAMDLLGQLRLQLTGVPATQPLPAADMSNLGPVLDTVLSGASAVLPGVPGSLLALGVGIAANYLGRQVIQSRLRDHHTGANIGR